MIQANNPALKSWVEVPSGSDFPIQNIPFGVFKTGNLTPRVGTRIGDFVLDLKTLYVLGYLENLPFELEDFDTDSLNPMMKKGKQATRDLRNRISKLLATDHKDLSGNEHHVGQVLIEAEAVEMLMPVQVGDYTDFYSSRDHATNVGTMFRDPNNALLPNWLWIPVGYHGRSSSIIVSGESIHRPKGQIRPNPEEDPIYAPCRLLDFELEMAFVTFDGKPLGDSITTAEAEDYIFGMCLFNDWSARDIQTWEYVPLGPFLAKNFASSISPWIVTMDALEPFKLEGPVQDPKVLSYLEYEGKHHYDINLEVAITPENGEETVICNSNYKHMYWNMVQQLAHHTVNGCNINCGDMMASGTISGPEPNSYGSMLELSWRGTKPLQMKDGSERKFIQDHDTVTMRGTCMNGDVKIGFGEVATKVLPAK
ncbi:fumarylacetoacetate hydrolase [Lishizhenia tianjinensis]|uniref:fumarylacetoacetase n=1 Tax=Lishizhenia tianjinensis TaxID=477690 RepID=A0A1I6XWW5_9FLAO|nr:fumarylacetoacetase [Lishizhenia tianjinensis]SFT42716.1 fumarylacetoacetate hydrolase [Lishizhenia tianjinensis]